MYLVFLVSVFGISRRCIWYFWLVYLEIGFVDGLTKTFFAGCIYCQVSLNILDFVFPEGVFGIFGWCILEYCID